jgi:hypothetical protein
MTSLNSMGESSPPFIPPVFLENTVFALCLFNIKNHHPRKKTPFSSSCQNFHQIDPPYNNPPKKKGFKGKRATS